MHVYYKTDTDCTPPPRSRTHPNIPLRAGTLTLVATWRSTSGGSLLHSLFAGTTPLRRRTAFAAAGRCLERGRSSTPAGVSSLRVPVTALPHALPRVAARETRERCRCHKSQHSTGVARRNPIPGCPSPSARHVGGPTFRRRAVATSQHSLAAGGARGSQGVRRNPCLAASERRDRAG